MRSLSITLLFLGALLAIGCSFQGAQHPEWLEQSAWNHAPITMQWNEIGKPLDASIEGAVEAWNAAAGCEVLAKAKPGATADVDVDWYTGAACSGTGKRLEEYKDAIAGAWRCSPTKGEVRFKEMADVGAAFVVAEHEFGHVLGLDHDRSYVMGANLPDTRRFPLPLPSDADAAAVAARYCHK